MALLRRLHHTGALDPWDDDAKSDCEIVKLFACIADATNLSHPANYVLAHRPLLGISGLVEELVDCSGGDEVSLESGVARKLQALHASLRWVLLRET